MFTKDSLIQDLSNSGIKGKGSLLIHSSMKAVGEVDGGADTVLDAFTEYMKDGLLLFPTHSWSDKNLIDDIYDPITESSCVGILTNLFLKRDGVFRSLHPTHSVTAMGKRAKEYVLRDNEVITPCPRSGCFGGLYDEGAQILFLGAPLSKNTYIHSLEEMLKIPNRINQNPKKIKIKVDNENMKEIDFYGHYSTLGDVSENYVKLLEPMLKKGMASKIEIGDAVSYLVEVRPMADWVLELLKKNPGLFNDKSPIIED